MRVDEKATARSVSLFPHHYAIIDECAVALNLRGTNTFSPAVQHIIEQYDAQRRLLALLPPDILADLQRQLAAQQRGEVP